MIQVSLNNIEKNIFRKIVQSENVFNRKKNGLKIIEEVTEEMIGEMKQRY